MDWSIDVSVRIARALDLKLDVLPTLHFVCDICACGFVCISMDGRGMGRTSSLGVMSILQDLGNVLCPRWQLHGVSEIRAQFWSLPEPWLDGMLWLSSQEEGCV